MWKTGMVVPGLEPTEHRLLPVTWCGDMDEWTDHIQDFRRYPTRKAMYKLYIEGPYKRGLNIANGTIASNVTVMLQEFAKIITQKWLTTGM